MTAEKIKQSGGIFQKILSFAPLLINFIPGFQGLGFIAQTLWTAGASAATSFAGALATGASFKQAILGAAIGFGTAIVAAGASKISNNLFHGLPALDAITGNAVGQAVKSGMVMNVATMGAATPYVTQAVT